MPYKSPEVRARYFLEWSRKNKDKVRLKKQARYKKLMGIIRLAKDRPCAICGKSYPACVMQFDHIPGRGRKLFCVALGTAKSESRLTEEIAKCDVVCANCHAVKTEERRGEQRLERRSRESLVAP